MPDISQTLGFDATQAIASLQALDSALKAFSKSVGGVSRSLNNFNTIGAKVVATLNNLGPSSVGQVAATFNQVSNNASQAATSLKTLGNAANTNLAKASQGAERLTVSFGTLVRVINTQLIVRALSSIRNAFEDSVQSAIGFQTQLAQIQTIGGNQVGTLDEISKQVRTLSETFAQPVEDVAAGFYEILSNQIGNAADSALVLNEALKLSKAAVSTTADAANALSSIINSYGLAASDAADISGKLFAAVDKGRFVLSEIANTIGRVTTVGAELGVSIDEIFASLSVLTINGVKADEGMTLLGNAMRSLLKPTEGMKAAFAELGITSGEVGVATFGFQGFLEKLRETTKGTASEVTQLTDNIRVGRAVFGLTGKAAEQYAENLKAIKEAGAGESDKAFNLIIDTNAQQVQRELTALRNFFVVDFGQGAIKTIKELSDVFGGLLGLFKSFGQAITAVGVSFALFKAGKPIFDGITDSIRLSRLQCVALQGNLGATQIAAQKAGASIKGAFTSTVVLAGVTAITTAIIALSKAQSNAGKNFRAFVNNVVGLGGLISKSPIFDEDVIDFSNATNQAANDLSVFAAQQETRTAILTAQAKKRQHIEEESVNTAFSEQLKLVAEIDKAYQLDVENAKEAQKQITDNLKDQLKRRLGILEDLIGELENKQKDAERTIARNQKETDDISLKNDERVFDRRLKLIDDGIVAASDGERQFAQLNRSRQLQAQAAAAISKDAASPEDFKAADELLKSAEGRANAALDEADARIKEASTQSDRFAALQQARSVEDEINKIVGQRIQLREQENKQAREVADAAAKDLVNRRQQLADAKLLIDQITKLKVVSKDANANIGTRQQAIQEAGPLLDKLQDVLSQGDLNLEQFLGVQDFAKDLRNEFQSSLDGRPLSLKDAFSEGINDIFNQLEGRTIQLKAEIDIVEKASGKKFSLTEGTKNISLGLLDKQKDQLQGLEGQSTIPNLESQISIAQKKIDLLAQGVLSNKLDSGTFSAGDNLKSQLQGVGDAVGKALNGDTEALRAAQTELSASTKNAVEGGFTEAAKTLKILLDLTTQTLLQAEDLQAKRGATTPLQNAIDDGTAQAGELAQKRLNANIAESVRLSKLLDDTLAATGQGGTPVAIERVDSSLDGIAKAADNAAKNVAELRRQLADLGVSRGVINGGGTTTAQYFGGMIRGFSSGGIARHFADGGIARGTDTIPAVLSAGETVVDSKNSRKFFSELQSIRSGISPSNQPATSTTNTTIGDIHVHASGNPEAVARQVMAAIRREQRRGASR